MNEIWRHLVTALPLAAGFLLIWGVNVPRSRRQQQYPLPFIAVLYGIAALWVLYRWNLWFDRILEWVFEWMPFTESWYQVSWQFGFQNGLVLVGFAALKLGLRALVLARAFVGERFLGSRFVSEFYEYDSRTGEWFIRARFSLLRSMLLTLLVVSLLAALAIILLARNYPGWPVFQAIPFPAVPVIVIAECYFALAGLTRREAPDDLLGEEDSAERRVDYSTLRRVYRDQFGERVLADASRLRGPHLASSFESLHLLLKSPRAQEAAAGAYFTRLKEQGRELDPSYVKAAVSLMDGNSVLIHDPFLHDMTEYLSFPAHVRLLEGQNCLIIVGREGSEGDVAEWIREGTESISGVPRLWNVDVLGPHASPAMNIGILRAADLHSFDLLRTHDKFFRTVGLIIVIEPARVLATGQVGMRLVSERCRQGSPPVVVALDGNHDGLVDALSQLFQIRMTTVLASPALRGASSSMVWDAMGPSLRSKFAPGISRQVGTGMEIGAIALKYHVAEVDWVGGDSVPVHDLMWISGQYFQDLTAFAELETSQLALSEPVVPWSNAIAIKQRPNRFIVAEDEHHNLFERQRQLATRATRNGFVHIITGDYLMRDYLVANRAILESDPKAIPSIVADYSLSERSVVMRLMASMELAPITEPQLRRELQAIGATVEGHAPEDGEPVVLRELRTLIKRHTGIRDVNFEHETRLVDVTDTAGERSFSISGGPELSEFLRGLRSAYFVVEDSEEERDYIGACLYGHVHQTFLPGQFITYVGKHYEVMRVASTTEGDRVILRRAADHIRERRVYRPLLTVSLADMAPVSDDIQPRQVSGVGTSRMRGRIEVATEGFVEARSRSGGEIRRVELTGIPVRTYTNKEVLRITLPGAPPSTRRAIALLLNEMFVTTFPQAHPFLWAITQDDGSDHADLMPSWAEALDDESIIIFEDSMVDLGLIVAVERNLQRIMEIVTDVVAWEVEVDNGHANRDAPTGRSGFVGFEGESPEEAETRQEIARRQDAGEVVRQPRRSRFRRWWRKLVGIFRKQPPTTSDTVPDGDQKASPPGIEPDEAGGSGSGDQKITVGAIPLVEAGEPPGFDPPTPNGRGAGE